MNSTEIYTEETKKKMRIVRLLGTFALGACLFGLALSLLLCSTAFKLYHLIPIVGLLFTSYLIVFLVFSIQNLTVFDDRFVPPERPFIYILKRKEYSIPLKNIEIVMANHSPFVITITVFLTEKQDTKKSFISILKREILDLDKLLAAFRERSVVVKITDV